MRDGSVLRGRVSAQNTSMLTLETSDGIKEMEKTSIFRVFYDEAQFEAFEKREGPRLADMRAQASEWEQRFEAFETQWQEKLDKEKARHAAELKAEKDRASADVASARSNARGELRGELWRSALLPGWPQWRRGQKTAAVLLMSGTAVALINLQQSYTGLYGARNEFADPTAPAVFSQLGAAGLVLNYSYFEDKSALVQKAQARVNLAWLILAAVWTTGIVHTTFMPPAEPASLPAMQPQKSSRPPFDISLTVRF